MPDSMTHKISKIAYHSNLPRKIKGVFGFITGSYKKRRRKPKVPQKPAKAPTTAMSNTESTVCTHDGQLSLSPDTHIQHIPYSGPGALVTMAVSVALAYLLVERWICCWEHYLIILMLLCLVNCVLLSLYRHRLYIIYYT